MFLAHSPSTFMVHDGWLKVWKKKMLPPDRPVGMLPTVCKKLQMTAADCALLRAPVLLVHYVLGNECAICLDVIVSGLLCHRSDQSLCGTEDVFSLSSVGMYSHSIKSHMCYWVCCVAYVSRILHNCVAAICLRLFFLHSAASYAKKKEHKNNPESSRRLAGDKCCDFRSSI